MQIQLSDQQLSAAMQEALVLAIPQAARDKLIAEALNWITAPQKDSYWGTKASPLQAAFNNAMEHAASKMIREELENPDSEMAKALADLVQTALGKMRATDRYQGIAEKFAEALSRALSSSS